MKLSKRALVGLCIVNMMTPVAGPAFADGGSRGTDRGIKLFPNAYELKSWGLAETGAVREADPERISNPEWLDETIARVKFNYSDDQRSGSKDFDTFKINPGGIIDGHDLHNQIQPKSPEAYRRAIQARVPGITADEIHSHYQAYLEGAAKQNLALLFLNRIIDEEAMKMRLDPDSVSAAHARYIMRSVLIRNAMSRGKIAMKKIVLRSKQACKRYSDGDIPAGDYVEGEGCVERDLNGEPKYRIETARVVAENSDLGRVWRSEGFCREFDDNGNIIDPDYVAPGVLQATGCLYKDKAGAPVVSDDAPMIGGDSRNLPLMYSWLIEMHREAREAEKLRQCKYRRLIRADATDASACELPEPLVVPIAFNIDWTFSDPAVAPEIEKIRREPVQYPPVRLEFNEGLPASAQAFISEITMKLLPAYRVTVRRRAWAALMRKHAPDYFQKKLMFGNPATITSLQDMGALYESMRDQAFKVSDIEGRTNELVISGAKAGLFEERFQQVLKARQDELLQELFGSGAGRENGASGAGGENDLAGRITAYRKSEPRKIFEQVAAEFKGDIDAGQVKVTFRPKVFLHRGNEELPRDESVESRQKRAIFTPMFSSISLFPKHQLDDDGRTRMVFLEEIAAGETSYVGIDDPRVKQMLRTSIEQRDEANAIRKTVHSLFSKHRIELVRNLCSDPSWPCVKFDAAEWVNLIFPEVHHPATPLPVRSPRISQEFNVRNAVEVESVALRVGRSERLTNGRYRLVLARSGSESPVVEGPWTSVSELGVGSGAVSLDVKRELQPGRYHIVLETRVASGNRGRVKVFSTPFSYFGPARVHVVDQGKWRAVPGKELSYEVRTARKSPEALASLERHSIALGLRGPGNPIPHTIAEQGLLGRVMEIKLELFKKAFEIPNGPDRHSSDGDDRPARID